MSIPEIPSRPLTVSRSPQSTRESSDMSTRRHSARSRVVLAQLWASASAATDPVQAHVLQLQNCEDKLRMILGTQVSTEKLIRLGVIDALIGSADGKQSLNSCPRSLSDLS